jgi:hypothetical protein
MTEDKLNKSLGLLKKINCLKSLKVCSLISNESNSYNQNITRSYNKNIKPFLLPNKEDMNSFAFGIEEDFDEYYFDEDTINDFNKKIQIEYNIFLDKINKIYNEEIEKLQKEFDKI